MPEFYKEFHKNLPQFEYRFVDLNKMSAKRLASYGLTYEAFPYTLKMIWALGDKKRTERVLGEILRQAEKMPPAQHRRFVKKALSYINSKYPDLVTKEVIVKTAKKVKAQKTLIHNLSLEEYAAMRNMEFGLKKGRKEGVAKGRQEGVAKGVAKGRQEGQDQMLALMLNRGSMQDVARLTGFSVQKLRQIKKKAA